MKNKYWLMLACSSFLLSLSSKASELSILKEKVDQAITQFEQTPRNHWAYELSRFEDEEGDITSSIERFSPHIEQSEQWQLLQINGDKPTREQQQDFVKHKLKEDKDNNLTFKIRKIINQESLKFQSDNNSHITMTFAVELPKLGEDAIGKLQGTLSYNKAEQFIETITIKNNAEFSPVFAATISDILLTFNFINIDGSVLPEENTLSMKGVFAYFTEINEVSVDTFSKFSFKGDDSSHKKTE